MTASVLDVVTSDIAGLRLAYFFSALITSQEVSNMCDRCLIEGSLVDSYA